MSVVICSCRRARYDRDMDGKFTTPRIPLNPPHPERVCWGCNKFCAAHDLACGNGTIRAPHPVELFGEDWLAWSVDGKRSSE